MSSWKAVATSLVLYGSVASAATALFGCWFEAEDNVYSFLVSGSSRLFHIGDLSFLINHQVGRLLPMLYVRFPGVPWLAVLYAGFQALGCCSVIYVLLRQQIPDWAKGAILSTLLLVFLLPGMVLLNFTRVAMLTAAAGWLFQMGLVTDNKLVSRLMGLLMILVALLIRIESALLATAMFATLAALLARSRAQMMRDHWPPLLLVAVYCAAIQVQIATSHSYHLTIEPDVEYAINFQRRTVELGTMATYRDSLRHMAASAWFIEDSVHVSPAFLRSLLVPERPMDYLNGAPAYLSDALGVVWPMGLAMLLLLLVPMPALAGRKRLAYIVVWAVGAMAVLTPILTVGPLPRVAQPTLALSAVCTMIFLLKRCPNFTPSRFWMPLTVIIPTACVFGTVSYVRSAADELSERWAAESAFLSSMDESHPGKTLVMIGPKGLFHRPALSVGPLSSHPILPMALGQLAYTPHGRAFTERYYPCDFSDYGCRLRHIEHRKAEVLLVGDTAFLPFFVEYHRELYGLDWHLRPVVQVTEGLTAYELL